MVAAMAVPLDVSCNKPSQCDAETHDANNLVIDVASLPTSCGDTT